MYMYIYMYMYGLWWCRLQEPSGRGGHLHVSQPDVETPPHPMPSSSPVCSVTWPLQLKTRTLGINLYILVCYTVYMWFMGCVRYRYEAQRRYLMQQKGREGLRYIHTHYTPTIHTLTRFPTALIHISHIQIKPWTILIVFWCVCVCDCVCTWIAERSMWTVFKDRRRPWWFCVCPTSAPRSSCSIPTASMWPARAPKRCSAYTRLPAYPYTPLHPLTNILPRTPPDIRSLSLSDTLSFRARVQLSDQDGLVSIHSCIYICWTRCWISLSLSYLSGDWWLHRLYIVGNEDIGKYVPRDDFDTRRHWNWLRSLALSLSLSCSVYACVSISMIVSISLILLNPFSLIMIWTCSYVRIYNYVRLDDRLAARRKRAELKRLKKDARARKLAEDR